LTASPDLHRATFDDSGLFRYTLRRDFGTLFLPLDRCCLFVMLNPSTADAEDNDPTITRCIEFAKTWGYGSLAVGNLFAYRSTDQLGLLRATDPVGTANDAFLAELAAGSALIVCGWGRGKTPRIQNFIEERAPRVLSILRGYGIPHCLGTTQGGFPKHPLYLPGKLLPVPFGS
jgi:hypothetical protein